MNAARSTLEIIPQGWRPDQAREAETIMPVASLFDELVDRIIEEEGEENEDRMEEDEPNALQISRANPRDEEKAKWHFFNRSIGEATSVKKALLVFARE
jgi:hypothetical protein